MAEDKLDIDCYGKWFRPEIPVTVRNTAFRFIYDDERKQGKRFCLGLFLNQGALARQYARYPAARRVCVLTESPINSVYQHRSLLERRYRHVFTHSRRLLSQGEPYRRLLFGTNWIEGAGIQESYPKTRLLSFIGNIQHADAPGYDLRRAVAEHLLRDPRAECFGRGIREIESKAIGLADYAFSITMENAREDDYFSEKLIDCFLTDTVPVYWGCPGIGQTFDLRGMICFNALEDLAPILDALSMDRYRKMLPFIRANQQKAVRERWHSLEGLYARLAEGLMSAIPNLEEPVPTASRAAMVLRRLTGR